MGPDSSLTPDLIQSQAFSTAFRGFDQAEVRAFLNRVATEMRHWHERAEHLESAWHSAEERAARPPVLDEDTLMAAVGEETASILRSARNAAGDLRTRAGEEAEKLLGEARAEADRIRSEARHAMERATSAAEEAAARIVATARAESAESLEKARIEADNIRSKAEKDRQLTMEGANATRDRILEDLARRRKVATVQIEQLRAGRERLIESYAVVRRTLEEAQSELSRADAEARMAADEVGRRMRHDVELPPLVEPEPTAEPETLVEPESAVESESAVEPEAHPSNGVDPAGKDPSPPAGAPSFTLIRGSGAPAGGVAVETPPSAVEQLFARIRGDRPSAKAVESEPAVEAEPSVESGPADAERSAGPAAEPAVEAEAEPATPETASATAGTSELESNVEPELTAETTAEEAALRQDEGLFQRRESALLDIEATLTRHLKRALQDEQNDVLDRLRSLKGDPTAEALLPARAEQVDRYAKAARPLLEKAAAAGVEFASSVGPSGDAAAPSTDVADLAGDAGAAISSPLRRRLEQALTESDDDQAVLVESLGAAYREWKTQRIERLAGDVVAAAFSRGTWEATPAGGRLRWIVEDLDGPCPDCDDDALAGEIAREEAFPTGQHHPPAHSGCRCLLVPAAAGD